MTNIVDEFAGRVNPVSINIETLQYLDSMIKTKYGEYLSKVIAGYK